MSAYYNENDPKTAAWLKELIRQGLIADGEVEHLVIGERNCCRDVVWKVLSEQLAAFTDAAPKSAGWKYQHEHQNDLIGRDGWMCETHPGRYWPHDDCAGPGMPWSIE